jgi:hypothetical protein
MNRVWIIIVATALGVAAILGWHASYEPAPPRQQ